MPNVGSKTVWRQLGIAVLFAALAVLHTWPLATAPGTWSRNDNSDAVLNAWALAWVAHQGVHDPAHLFDANIFYPERRTLAYSEHLIPEAVMVAPLSWSGVSPVAVHNVALWLGMVLTGWAMSWVIGRWTGNQIAGILAGAAAAFHAHTLTRLAHVQAQHVEFLPLALYALDRLLTVPRVRHALATAGWFALQAMASGYFLVFSSVALVVATLSRPGAWFGRQAVRFAANAALAGAAAVLLLAPTLWPYWRVREDVGLVRPLSEVAVFSASWGDYLATASRVHLSSWSHTYFRADALFPGVVVLLLVLVAIISRTIWRDPRCRMCAAVAVVSVALSFGPALPGYAWVHTHLPLFQGLRGAARFGHVALVMLAAVAGFGLAAFMGRFRRRAVQVAAGVLCLGLVTVEALRAPLVFTPFHGIPAIYDTLAHIPDAVLVHFPLPNRLNAFGNVSYMLGSTRHWHPMLNGYSGFVPESYTRSRTELGGFPDARALAYLRGIGVTHVVIHEDAIPAARAAQIRACADLARFATDGHTQVYVLLK